MTILGQSVGKARRWHGEWSPMGGFQEYSMYSLGRRLKVPQGKSKATSKARPKAKNPRGRRPQGLLAFCLAKDVAKGLPLENPEQGFQYFSEGVH